MKTNVAATSITAYREHEAMGALSRQQKKILEFLADHADVDYTRKEIGKALSMEHSTVCGRVNELLADIERLWLDELDSRKCRISGKTASPVRIHRPAGQLDLFGVAA